MGKATGFIEYPRVEPGKRSCEERILDWNEIKLPLDYETLRIQGARCMDCGVPFCHGGVLLNGMVSGCPLHNLIPEWNELVYLGQWEEAYQRLARTNPFPEFTARVCPAPCEGACTVGYIWEPVAINSIECAIIEKAFEQGWVNPVRGASTGYHVAVVGSGPAGLSAAHYLNAVGHDVTVFERDERAGGLMMYGIPNMKLDKNIIDRRIDLMRSSGIVFKTNTEVGKDISARELVDSHDAVILCIGAARARDLQVEGRDLKGIHFAVDFLKANTRRLLGSDHEDSAFINTQDKDVIIIGGGDTGTDCVATAIRHGCKSVSQFEILPAPPEHRIASSNPWPEWPRVFGTDYGQAEAISRNGLDPRHYLLSTRKFTGNERGEVQKVHTVAVTWVSNASGVLIPREIAGSEKVWPADLVLLAMGFTGPEDSILEELKLDRDERSNVKAEFGVFETSSDKVFAAGDMRRGQSLVVWAIQEGKLAAREVDKCLTGHSLIK